MSIFDSLLGRPPESIIDKELFESAKSDAEIARTTISNHTKDIQLRRDFLKAMESHDTGKQESLQKEFQDLHETPEDKKKKKKDRPEYKMAMAPDELGIEINTFLDAILDMRADLLEALKNQRFSGDQTVDREIRRVEETLKKGLNDLVDRRTKLREVLSQNSNIYGLAGGEGLRNSEKSNELSVRIDRIESVLSMNKPSNFLN
jgi:hypothetical protein